MDWRYVACISRVRDQRISLDGNCGKGVEIVGVRSAHGEL